MMLEDDDEALVRPARQSFQGVLQQVDGLGQVGGKASKLSGLDETRIIGADVDL